MYWAQYHLIKTEYKQAETLLRSLVLDSRKSQQSVAEISRKNVNCFWQGGIERYIPKYAESEGLYQDVYQARLSRLTVKHRLTLQAAQLLAGIYRLQQNYQNAEELLLSTLDNQRQKLGNVNPNTIRTIQALCSLYIAKVEFSKAEPFAVEAVATGKKLYEDDHPMMMVYYNDLAAVQVRLQKMPEAISTFAKLTELSTARNGENHASSIGFALNWASCLYLNKQYIEAESLYLKVQPRVVKKYGVAHPTYYRVLRSLAQVCGTMGRWEAADTYWTELLIIDHKSKDILPHSLFADIKYAAECKFHLMQIENFSKLLTEADSIQVGPKLVPYLQVALRRLQAELAMLQANPIEAKRRLLEAVDILKRDLAANPKRYQEDPFAIEERAALRKTLEQWIQGTGGRMLR